jgi:type II secretory pathway component PulF
MLLLNLIILLIKCIPHFVPVLPSFSGNVPAALKKIFPSANITRLGDWYFSFLNAILLCMEELHDLSL